MYPSEKKRNAALKISSYELIKKIWIIAIIALTVILVPIGLVLPIEPNEKLIFIISVVVFMAFLAGMAFLIMSLVKKLLVKGIEYYEPNIRNRIPFHELCREAMKLNDETIWLVEPHENEGWIDVTWKWKNSVDVSGFGINKNEEIFYKLIKIYDDYTYEDLDMITSKNAMLSIAGGGFSKQFAIGHIQDREYRITIGSDDSGMGVHEYSINTKDLTNFMHKWLAERGYQYRGL